jgi:hypothetical protein
MKELASKRYYDNPKICLACGGVIPLKYSAYDTRKKKFCNHRCAAHHMNKTRVVIRNCARCGKVLISSQKNYCSFECRAGANLEANIRRWIAGEIEGGYDSGALKDFAKTHLIITRGEKCEECGWSTTNPYTNKIPITFHHINGNPRDHRPENIKILCPSCHSLTETYGGANRGNGRKNRKR